MCLKPDDGLRVVDRAPAGLAVLHGHICKLEWRAGKDGQSPYKKSAQKPYAALTAWRVVQQDLIPCAPDNSKKSATRRGMGQC